MDLYTRVAIVTGSGQGIGREIALRLAEVGASVVIADVNPDTANGVAAEVEAKAGKSLAVAADVTVHEEVTRLVDETVSCFGRVDILVNNAENVGQ